MALNIYVGWDQRETPGYMVCVRSMLNHSSCGLNIKGLVEHHLRAEGLYTRTWHREEDVIAPNKRVDDIDGKPFSTDFSFTRWLVPALNHYRGWALFCDADFLWRADVGQMFQYADPKYAALVVKHNYQPTEEVKMDLQKQEKYPRKNWSSCVLWNCGHPAHKALTVEAVNTWTGRQLQTFSWLPDELMGELPEEWNWLEGWSSPDIDPKVVHHTRGTPDMKGYENISYADEWREVLNSIEGVTA